MPDTPFSKRTDLRPLAHRLAFRRTRSLSASPVGGNRPNWTFTKQTDQ